MDEPFIPFDINCMEDCEIPQPCAHGHFWAGDERGCVTCSSGHYCPEGTLDYQFPCLGGTFNDQAGQWQCIICEPGFFCPEQSSSKTVCPAGKFNKYYGMDRCIPCPVGHRCSIEGLFDPEACPPGTWQD